MQKNKSLEESLKIIKKREEKELQQKMKNNIIQLSIFEEEKRPFFSQGLIEKTIFLPNSSRKKSYVVAENQEYQLSIGTVGGKKEFGILKIRHRDVLYALLRLWAENNWKTTEYEIKNADNTKIVIRTGYVKTNRHEILSLILKKRPGKKDYDSLMDTLWDLKTIPINLIDKKEKDISKIFSLLNSFSFNKKDVYGELTIYFNEEITKNYYRKKDLKLKYLETFRNFKSEVASILYPVVDRNLSQMSKYSVKIEKLCEQTGLSKYKYISEYKKKWKTALNELNKTELSCKIPFKCFLEENRKKELIFVAERI